MTATSPFLLTNRIALVTGASRGLGLEIALGLARAGAHVLVNSRDAGRCAAVAASIPYDFILSPTAPMTAYAAELPSPSNDPLNPFPHIGFTVSLNMSEQPAASINCGYDAEGMPIGLQIIGRRFDDVGVLSVARGNSNCRQA